MKLLVFAHTPPPHHGQSYMVQLMLEGFGEEWRKVGREGTNAANFGIECYHVNARFSKSLQKIGEFEILKLVKLIGYCLRANWWRFRHGVGNFYYIPAPGQRVPLYRDWLVMMLCRPFFKNIILHWHAAGLAEWLESSAPRLVRWLSFRLLREVNLSIVLSQHNRPDAEKLLSREIRIVANGIPDPCPNFKEEVLPRRMARFVARRKLSAGEPLRPEDLQDTGGDPQVVKVLYVAHCTREKGLFDAVEAVAAANRKLASVNSALRFNLTVAGEFMNPAERNEFESRIGRPDLQLPESHRHQDYEGSVPTSSCGPLSAVRYLGFVYGAQKMRAFVESDCFCFPTYFHAESFGLVLVEAMAFGLPIVATRWRSLPELFPTGYPGLVDARSPDRVAEAMQDLTSKQSGGSLRDIFVRRFTLQTHLSTLAEALWTVERSAAGGSARRKP